MKLRYFCIIAFGVAASWAAAQVPAPRITPEIREAAEKGNPEAQYQMARAFATGRGAPRDPERAWKMMNAAAEQGNADAIGGLGFFHVKGIHVEKNGEEALAAFRKGAELGSPTSQLNLARCLLGEETLAGISYPPVDPAELERWREEGIEWLRKAAEAGLPAAAAGLGRCYDQGQYGLPQDRREAARWLTVAAEAGDASSQNLLGVIYDQGLAGERNEDEAIRWYSAAARQGVTRAQANLGQILGPGSDDKDRRIEAIAWLLLSEANGDITAKRTLDNVRPALVRDDLDAAVEKMKALRLEIASARSPFSRGR